MIKKIAKKIIDVLAVTGFLNFMWKIFGKSIQYWLNNINRQVLHYNSNEKQDFFRLIKQIKAENKLLLETNEAFQLYQAVKNTAKINGDIAEVGTYLGGSAKIICAVKGNKKLHLFDTFDGLPEMSVWDRSPHFYKGQFASSVDFVKNFLKDFNEVYLYKGLFPATSVPVENCTFSLVHLDVDLYEATAAGLTFFYSRMTKGGIIISHDYDEPGVKKAVDDFFEDKPEYVLEISGCQCLIVKL